MNAGPYGGLGEISLKAMQQGSSIMPGKINPVIPEMVMQTAMRVCANDTAITMAAGRGEFELNAFGPLMAESILESLELMSDTVRIFREKAVCTLQANKENCVKHLENSYAFATAYVPVLGYDKVNEIVNTNEREKAEKILEQEKYEREKTIDR